MNYGIRFTERIKFEDAILPNAGAAGTYLTGAVPLTPGRRFVFAVQEGTIGTSGTVNASIQWSATSGGTYATVGTSSIAQDAAGSKVHLVEVTAEQIANLYPTAKYIKGQIVTAVAATPIAGLLVSSDHRTMPVVQGTVVGQVVTANA